MTRAQECAIERAALHDNLVGEMAAVIQRYIDVDYMRGENLETTDLHRTAKAVLAKAKEQS
ncbi:hypothetical protein [Cupriavidus sp. CuC1]|uniref:hypothetical protein n=1 Tax=Cupriavidus sp. CuC1 TaxID=3373131 RepID=UPI0037CF5BE1